MDNWTWFFFVQFVYVWILERDYFCFVLVSLGLLTVIIFWSFYYLWVLWRGSVYWTFIVLGFIWFGFVWFGLIKIIVFGLVSFNLLFQSLYLRLDVLLIQIRLQVVKWPSWKIIGVQWRREYENCNRLLSYKTISLHVVNWFLLQFPPER